MGSKNNLNIGELLTGFDSMKMSALRNAAKLSPLIKECTLGPNCVDLSKTHLNSSASIVAEGKGQSSKENDPNVSNEDTSKVEKSPKQADGKIPCNITFTLRQASDTTDCAAVSSKVNQESIERQRQAAVAKIIAERQSKIKLADEKREAQLQQSLQEAKLAAARKLQVSEQQLLQAVREQEQLAQQAAARRQAEIEQENRRQSDIQEQLRRRQEKLRKKTQLIETIRQHNEQFSAATETFTKALTDVGVQHATKFSNQKKSVRALQKDFEQLFRTIYTNHDVSQADVDQASDYCKQLDQVNGEVTEIIAQIEASQKQQQQQHQQQQQQQQEQAAQQPPPPPEQQQITSIAPVAADSTDNTTIVPAAPPATGVENEPFFLPVSPECLQFYNEIKVFYEQHQTAVKQLMDDPSMKAYRFNCQKAINVPVNAISAVNQEHLIDKYNRLAALLSGQNVKAGEGTVSINGHPLGRTYCTMLLAKKFVSQGDTSISSNASAAFPIAAIVVALWQRFPDFGRFFLAYLHRECPYLVPYYLPQLEGQSQEEHLKTLGFRFAEGGLLEKQDQYLKRMSGLARLYAAVIVTVPRTGEQSPHPHGLEYGWRWLSNIVNRFPQPDICATLIVEFLQTAGADLHAAYGKQFLKVLRLLQGDYMTALNRIDTGGPRARLEGLLVKIFTEGKIPHPEGKMSANFW